MRPPHPSVADQGADDALGGRVDRNGEPETDACEGCVDPDDAAGRVGERAPRVAGVERRVGLDNIVDDPDLGTGSGRERAPQGTHHARGDAAGEAEGIADGHHQLADPKHRSIAESRRLEIAVLRYQHREVGERVPSPDAKAELAAVGKIEPAAVTTGDHVGRGHQVPVGAERDRRAASEWGASPAGSDLHRRDRRCECGGYLGERARVCVEQLAVIARVSRHRDLRPAPSERR